MDRLAALLTAPVLPAWALAGRLHPRWRTRWRARWGLELPPVQPGAIWVHAASLGEVGAAWAVVRELPEPVLWTADTDAGVERAEALADGRPGIAVGAKPVDHWLTLAPLWAEARPRLVVFVEGTFWPALAWRAHREGVPVVRVSARAGPRTRRFRPVLRAWWWPVTAVWARDAESAAFLRGVHRGPVEVGGDLKAGLELPPNPLRWPGPFSVAASTRDGDEARWLAALDAVDPRGRCLVAPREPGRFDDVAALLTTQGRRWVRRTALVDGQVPEGVDVVLLDTLGELAGCLRGARVVFVGGTFDAAIGGHSPWEAAAAGAVVVAGPDVHGQGDAFARVGAIVGPDLADVIPRPSTSPPGGASSAPSPRRGEGGGRGDQRQHDLARQVEGVAGPPAPESSPRPWALPAARLVGLAVRARNAAYDRGWLPVVAVGVPVISVGSTNARGPGKTSTVRALVGVLLAEGHTVGVALRGYRRTDRTDRVRVSWETTAADALGDEGALLAAVGAKVAAGPDRVDCARTLVDAGCTVILLDDGLQHRRLHRDLDVAVVDARFPAGRGLLPAGERREPEVVPARVDVVLVHHGGGAFGFPGEVVVRTPTAWEGIGGPADPPQRPVAALAGTARPADFLASLDLPVARFLALTDHAPIVGATADRVRRWAGDLPIATTGKDAVRLPADLRARAVWRDVDLGLPAALLERVTATCGAAR